MYYDGIHVIRVPLSLNNTTEDIANGKIGTWTSSKTLKVQARDYSAYYAMQLHRVYHWEGTGNPQNVKPTLQITAIA